LTYHFIPTTTDLTAGYVRIWKAHWGQHMYMGKSSTN